jgi:hypothetical protein
VSLAGPECPPLSGPTPLPAASARRHACREPTECRKAQRSRDEGNADEIIAYARTRSARLWVPLRVVHAWTERGIGPAGLRVLCRDRVDYADRLLSAVLHDHGPAAESTAAERQILHDDDPAHALVALSREAALLVVALNSDPTASDATCRTITVTALLGRG